MTRVCFSNEKKKSQPLAENVQPPHRRMCRAPLLLLELISHRSKSRHQTPTRDKWIMQWVYFPRFWEARLWKTFRPAADHQARKTRTSFERAMAERDLLAPHRTRAWSRRHGCGEVSFGHACPQIGLFAGSFSSFWPFLVCGVGGCVPALRIFSRVWLPRIWGSMTPLSMTLTDAW